MKTIPGTTYRYSNAGKQFVGNIPEKIYRTNYENLFSEYITGPLNIKQSIVGTNSADLLTGYNEKWMIISIP